MDLQTITGRRDALSSRKLRKWLLSCWGKNVALFVASAVVLSACAGAQPQMDRWVDLATKQFRSKGEKLDAEPDDVYRDEGCRVRILPFLRLDRIEVIPATAKPGDELNQRLVYSMCPEGPGGALRGRFTQTLYLNGKRLVSDSVDDFTVKPGRWIVDTFLEIPGNARRGSYYLEAEFIGDKVAFQGGNNFIIQ